MKPVGEVNHEIIKELRVVAGLTQNELAGFLNISRSTYAKYETGDLRPNGTVISKLAKIYEVNADSFYVEAKKPVNRLRDICDRSEIEMILLGYFRLVQKEYRDECLEMIKDFAKEHPAFSGFDDYDSEEF